MLKTVECSFCDGVGKVLKNGPPYGDPMDPGKDCPNCKGAGCVEVDLNDFCDDDEAEEA